MILEKLENQDKILRAVIIDQLSEEIPNENFQKKAIKIFEDAGYKVDLVFVLIFIFLSTVKYF